MSENKAGVKVIVTKPNGEKEVKEGDAFVGAVVTDHEERVEVDCGVAGNISYGGIMKVRGEVLSTVTKILDGEADEEGDMMLKVANVMALMDSVEKIQEELMANLGLSGEDGSDDPFASLDEAIDRMGQMEGR